MFHNIYNINMHVSQHDSQYYAFLIQLTIHSPTSFVP